MKNPRNYLFLFVILLLAFGSGSVYGWQAGNGLLVNETYLEMESVGNPNISPDGNFILFTRTGVDKMKDRSKSNLLMYNMESGRISELTTGSFRVSSPVWSPDGGKIVFLSDRSGTNQIHMMWLDTREVIQLTNLDQSPGGLRWSPDGGKIAFTMFTVDDSPILPVKIPKFPKGADMAKPAIVIDRLSWRRDGSGPTQKGNTHIYTIEVPLGGTPVQITSGDYSHSGPRWSPDGKYIYFSGILKPDVEYQRGDLEIYSIDLSTHDITPLTDRKGPDRSPVISP
ncbi:PD40 domain-containing protein, partial [candidate division KSB1 bacterium]|nr:PD40 domain-containing protein [candidate division KSB1 bacterium]